MSRYYILDGHELVACDMMTWARWYNTVDRHVRCTEQGDVMISTVFLGHDYSWGEGRPVVFETMVFEGEHSGEMERYSTWGQAEAGHARWVAKVFKPTPILPLPKEVKC